MANGTIAVSQLEILTQSGTGIISVVPPTTNTNRTVTIPDATTTLVGTDATQTLTNKTLSTGLVMSASAITSGTAVASTSGTSIDFTSIPSWVKRVTVMFNGVSTNGTSLPLLQIGSGSITSSGYAAQSSYISGATPLNGISSTAGFAVINSMGAAYLYSGAATLTLIGSNTWTLTSSFAINSGASSQFFCAGVSPALSGALDRVRITTVNGTDTFDAGSINILYE